MSTPDRHTVDVVDLSESPDALDEVLPRAFAIVGRPDLPRERLDRAPKLRALLNVGRYRNRLVS